MPREPLTAAVAQYRAGRRAEETIGPEVGSRGRETGGDTLVTNVPSGRLSGGGARHRRFCVAKLESSKTKPVVVMSLVTCTVHICTRGRCLSDGLTYGRLGRPGT